MESFPKALERRDGARKYISTFWAPFQEPPLNPKEVHVLRACSLLVILPPPPGSEALPGSFADDLSEINLSDWADTVQDVVAGLLALPQTLSSCLLLEVVNLLLCLESITQVVFFHLCYLPVANCRCLGVTSLAPLTRSLPWSGGEVWPTWSVMSPYGFM